MEYTKGKFQVIKTEVISKEGEDEFELLVVLLENQEGKWLSVHELLRGIGSTFEPKELDMIGVRERIKNSFRYLLETTGTKCPENFPLAREILDAVMLTKPFESYMLQGKVEEVQ